MTTDAADIYYNLSWYNFFDFQIIVKAYIPFTLK